MALLAIVGTLDQVPEALHEHYVETEDGRFRLDAEGVEDVSGLKSALEKERAERKALKAELSALQPSDVADDALEAAELAVTEGADEGIEADAEPDGQVVEDTDTIEVDQNAAVREALEARLIDAEATAAIVAAHGIPQLLMPVIRHNLSLEKDENGSFRVVAVDETGAPLRRDAEGSTPLGVADLVEGLRADPIYARAFDGSGKGGSGAPTSMRGDTGPITVSASDPRAISRHIGDIAAGRVRVA